LTALNLIDSKGENFTDSMDILEFNHYIKMINSLRNEKIIKRCLLKDATASFVQNIIRLVGAKDEESKKIANLNSLEC